MPTSFSLPLVLLVVVFAVAVGSIVWVLVSSRQRSVVLRRTVGTGQITAAAPIRALKPLPTTGFFDWIAARVPAQLGSSAVSTSQLVHAGFEGEAASAIFALIRIASAAVFISAAFILAPKDDTMFFFAVIIVGVGVGLLAPTMTLERLANSRKATIRRGIPDTLDLLVVCVEAGVALDSALQRVAREMFMLHPILAEELMIMTRRVSAGMPREQAMHGLYLRTGVDELRGLSSHMLQSEKWGTSIATVLRLYSEQLRHRRRTAAEKRAATASTRMLIPLALFIFPTLFIVLLGPAVIRIMTVM